MKVNSENKKLNLLLTFLKIGAFTFGGGYAMIPLIQREIVTKKKWISDDDILDIIAIAESTPGPIAVNAATFVGYKVAGVSGSVLATLGVVLPSFVIIALISLILNLFMQFKAVQYAFIGIRAGVLALIVKAMFSMYKKAPHTLFAYSIMGLSFLLVTFLYINVLYVIIGAALLGLSSLLFCKGSGEVKE